MNQGIRRNNGIFEAETRLWSVYELPALLNTDCIKRACYIAVPLYLCGFLVLGAAFQEQLSVGALVMGWGLAEVATMVNTVAVCEYTFRGMMFFV